MARKITFEVAGEPGLSITASEQADGSLLFELDVTGERAANIRGLFFDINDPALLGGLVVAGDDIGSFDPDEDEDRFGGDDEDERFGGDSDGDEDEDGFGGDDDDGPTHVFDVSVAFGEPVDDDDDILSDIQSTSFSLSAADGTPLTLDLVANVKFGVLLTAVEEEDGERDDDSVSLKTVAPAAPDAIDDDENMTLEDTPVVIDVVANDTDADGDQLIITEVTQGANGLVEIVDNKIRYTPDTDFGGESDTFTYTIIDGNGGTDWANVEVFVEAVADVPDVSIQAFATDDVNVIRLVVTATQTDDDNSEFIDRILSSALPAGATLSPAGPVNPAGRPLQLMQEYFLTLPLDQDTNFDLTFTAVSEELSNGDQATGSETIEIIYENNTTLFDRQFSAQNQSIWSTGDEFTFDDERFFGIDTGDFDEDLSAGPFVAGIDGHIRLGFESDLHFEGGDINAFADYEVSVETNYNKTVDELLIETSALLTDTSFFTEGPAGTYTLDFVWDILLNAFAGVDIDLGGINLDPGGIIPGDQSIDFGSITETINIPTVDIGPGSVNILDLDSDTLGGTFDFPPPADVFSLDFAWPNITTSGTDPLNPVVASGASNNFLQLTLDVDQLLTRLLGLPVNPLNPVDFQAGPFFADLDLVNVFVNAGLNFLQEFEMAMGELAGVLMFEDGSNSAFTIGDSLQISDASLIDFNGDDDGLVEFDFLVAPASTLSNLTELGLNLGGGVEFFSVEVGYELSIPNPFSAIVGPDSFGFGDSFEFGPLASIGDSFPVAAVEVFNDDFDLAFQQQTLEVFV